MKCKFRLERAEAVIPGNSSQKKTQQNHKTPPNPTKPKTTTTTHKEIPRAERCRGLKQQSQIFRPEDKGQTPCPITAMKDLPGAPLQLYQALHKQENKPKNTSHLVNYVISAYTQEMLFQSRITAIAKASHMLRQHRGNEPCLLVTQ